MRTAPTVPRPLVDASGAMARITPWQVCREVDPTRYYSVRSHRQATSVLKSPIRSGGEKYSCANSTKNVGIPQPIVLLLVVSKLRPAVALAAAPCGFQTYHCTHEHSLSQGGAVGGRP
jgi:hypothetical protein